MYMTNINITKEEIKKIKKIGSGTEGIVFKLNNNYLIKIYRTQLKNILRTDKKYNNYIKIYNKDTFKINNNVENVNYFINNGD